MINRELLKRLEFDKILSGIAVCGHSTVTSQRLLNTIPLGDAVQIRLVSGQIEEIRRLAGLGVGLRLAAFEDIRQFLDVVRPAGAFLAPPELLRFIPVLQIFSDICRQFTPREDIQRLKSIEPALRPFPDILEPLQASLDEEGGILDGASPQLLEIRRAKRGLAARIRRKIEEIVRAANIDIFLQDDFITQRSGRWVIPVRMDSKGMVKGVVHDVSSSGETAFMEPLEIIPFVNELENLTAEEKTEEIRILRQLSAWIREDAAEIAACFETLVELDRLNAVARYADRYGLEAIAVNDTGRLQLAGARHPLLLMLQEQGLLSRVEPLDLELGGTGTDSVCTSVMVITGPNAGGKTIALKTAGILSAMALCGFPVPANGARSTFPLLDTLLVDIGDEQSIEESLSTFSAHVARISGILGQAGPGSLVLLDELGAGTEPQQGAAIACGVLKELQQCGATVIATTHLSDIIGYVHRTPGMVNAGMEYDAATFSPLYRLVCGEPGHSHAIDIARRFGLPERVITFAREMLGSAGADFTALLAELHRKREELGNARHELNTREQALRQRQEELEQRAADIEQLRREARERGWNEAKELISSNRRRMNELIEEFRQQRRTETADQLRKQEQELTEQLKPRAEDEQLLPLAAIAPGDRVHIRSLGHSGIVVQLLERQKKARVRAGSIELDVTLGDLFAPRTTGTGRKQPPVPPRQSWKVEAPEDERHELKLIGLRVDEALVELEGFLSRAILSGLREVRIIHGIGTGRLQAAVREHLGRHPLVDSFRAGEAHEGRDGATVATLRN